MAPLETVTLTAGIRKVVYFPADEPHFGYIYTIRVTGVGASIDELTVGVV